MSKGFKDLKVFQLAYRLAMRIFEESKRFPIEERFALTDQGRVILSEERRRREGWLARAIASELSADEQDVLIQAVPLLGRLAQS